jgi:hypothetical protein
VTDNIFRGIAMNYMSRKTYRRKILEAIEEKIELTQMHHVISRKVSEYELQIDKFDDFGTYLDDIGRPIYENSEILIDKINAVKTRIKKLKKKIRLTQQSKTLKNKSHCCFVLGVCERQIGGRLHGRNIGHKLICAGRDATDIRSAGSVGIDSWIFNQ